MTSNHSVQSSTNRWCDERICNHSIAMPVAPRKLRGHEPSACVQQRAFTLVELSVAMAIVALLVLRGVPAYADFMANTRIRNVAESFANGVRQAQLEAVKRNEPVRFLLTSDGWELRNATTGAVLETEPVGERKAGKPPAVAIEPPGASAITFNGVGRVLKKNPNDNSDPISKIKISPTGAGTRELGVAVAALGGTVKVCDPSSSFSAAGSSDPLRCPYPW